MIVKKKTCKQCKKRQDIEKGFQSPLSFYCSVDCAAKDANEKQQKARDKQFKKKRADHKKEGVKQRKALKERDKGIKPMSDWYDKLQKLVNQYVVHVRDVGKPCCTCGNADPSIKYDAGHRRSRGACPELRFEPTNIHKQCSQKCNVFGAGMPKEYAEFIKLKYGQSHLDWLDGPHKRLKDQFPDWQSVEAEIVKYRKLIRDAGLTPRA